MDALSDFLLFFSLIVFGVVLEDLAQKIYFKAKGIKFKEHHFSYSRYVYLLLFPMLAAILIVSRSTDLLWVVFLTFSAVGTFIEWLIGFFYHRIVGQRLWTYHRHSISGYTSLLSIPLWGLAGIMFWLLARIFI